MNEIYCLVYFRYLGIDYDAKRNFSENHDINYIGERIESILDPEKTDQSLFGTSGMAETYSTQRLALQFYDVQAEFNREYERKIVHMIVFFRDEACGIGDFMAAYMGRRIADYIGHRFQTIFAVHTNTENIHIHFIINPVSCTNGALYRTTTMTDLKRYYEIIDQIYRETYGNSIGGYGYCK